MHGGEYPVMEKKMGKGKILLVDDEEVILEVGKLMLKSMLKLTCSCWRLSCLRLEAGKPLACLRKKTKVKVILSSGYSINGDAQAIMGRGCNGFIQKPFNLQGLSQTYSIRPEQSFPINTYTYVIAIIPFGCATISPIIAASFTPSR
jgi:hypothetical protein